MSLINDIYNGEYYPAEQVKPDTELFRLHSGNAAALSEKLSEALTEEQRDLLDAYKSERAVVTDLYNMEFFRAGVKLGVRLLLEALDCHPEMTDMHK